jgi:hypothetical protein
MRNANQGSRVLVEGTEPKKTVARTGNRVNPIADSARADERTVRKVESEIAELRRLAGIE